jgi:hypothetical protein
MSTTTEPSGADRLDSLAWNRFHTVALLALGVG